jgi:hypothetical protein
VVVEAAYLGDDFEGSQLIAPLRALGPQIDTFANIPAAALGELHMDPPQPVPGQGDGTFLADFPAGAIDALVEVAGADSGSPLLSVEVRHCGGALASGDSDGVQSRIDAKYMVFGVGLTPTAEIGEAVASHCRVLLDTLAPWAHEHAYYNLAETPAGADEVLSADAYGRLREIKAKYDPADVIISAHPVRPAR